MKNKNTVIFITSIAISCLFIGAALPSVFAGSISREQIISDINDEPCSSCTSKIKHPNNQPSCKSCNEAVAFAVEYMKNYVKERVNDTYFLWTVDVSILIFDGLVKGFKESGYTPEINVNALKANIEYWVNKTVGPQKFTVTLFLAKLGAITIGVTGYLLTLCTDGNARNTQTKTKQIRDISWINSRSILWIILKHLLGLFF